MQFGLYHDSDRIVLLSRRYLNAILIVFWCEGRFVHFIFIVSCIYQFLLDCLQFLFAVAINQTMTLGFP